MGHPRNHMFTWRYLVGFTDSLDEKDLKKRVIISNPSHKFHFVKYFTIERCKTSEFSIGTIHIKAGPKITRCFHACPTWEKLVAFLTGLEEKDLDKEAYISSPKNELHVISFCKKLITDIYIQAGRKKKR